MKGETEKQLDPMYEVPLGTNNISEMMELKMSLLSTYPCTSKHGQQDPETNLKFASLINHQHQVMKEKKGYDMTIQGDHSPWRKPPIDIDLELHFSISSLY